MEHFHAVKAWQGARYVSDAGHAFYSIGFYKG